MLALYDVAAPAKLNLFLHVIGRRADGYHLLQSVFVLIDWCDTLHFERRGDGRLARHDLTEALPADDLCLRAARALQTAGGCSFGADIHISKQVPSGAGMGGGSSDAASTLLALNRLWDLNWPLSRLLPLGLSLGADVPFFLGGRPAFVEGIGEILTPLQLPEQRFAVLKPQASLPTAQIFSSPLLARDTPAVIVAGFPADTSSNQLKKITAEMIAEGFGHNDLQPPAESQSVEVAQALELLKARFGNSRMTGSGSAVFARVDAGIDRIQGMSESPKMPEELPPGWAGRMCQSLELHPLVGWAAD